MDEIIYYKELNKNCFKGIPEDLILKLTAKRYIKEDKDNNKYFHFVGVISLGRDLIAVLPKVTEDNILKDEGKSEEQLKFIIKLLKLNSEYEFKKQLESESDTDLDTAEDNRIGIMDYFFRDYAEYGLYTNEKEQYTLNGDGGINWERTIKEEEAVLSRGRPIYLDLHTRIDETDEEDYIMELHKYILEQCIKKASNLPVQRVFDIFDIPNISFNISEDRIGDKEYQLQMIEREMRVQFNERKVKLLKAMKLYLEGMSIKMNEGVSVWGTRGFWSVWENACRYVFANEYKEGSLYWNSIKKLTSGIWSGNIKKSDSMKPDFVKIYGDTLYIADAKYYNEKGFCRNLGVQDIAKQFMYEKALEEQIPVNGKVKNIFLVPGKGERYISSVEMGIFPNKSVYALTLDAEKVLKDYLKGNKRDIEELISLIPPEE